MFNKIRQIRNDAIQAHIDASEVLKALPDVKSISEPQKEKILNTLAALRKTEMDYEEYGTHLFNRLIRFVVCYRTMKKVKEVYQWTISPLTMHLFAKRQQVQSCYPTALKDEAHRSTVEAWYNAANKVLNLHEKWILRKIEEVDLPLKMQKMNEQQRLEKEGEIFKWYNDEIKKINFYTSENEMNAKGYQVVAHSVIFK